MRNQITENELKIKTYKNSSQLLNTYHEEHFENKKVKIEFNDDSKSGKKPGFENESYCHEKDVVKPSILKNFKNLLSKRLGRV